MIIAGNLFCIFCHKFHDNLLPLSTFPKEDGAIKSLEDIFGLKITNSEILNSKICPLCSNKSRELYEFYKMVTINIKPIVLSGSDSTWSAQSVESPNIINLDDLTDDILRDNAGFNNNEIEDTLPDVLQDYQDPGDTLNVGDANKATDTGMRDIPSPKLVRIPTPPMIQIPSSSVVSMNCKNLQLGTKVKIFTNPKTGQMQLVPCSTAEVQSSNYPTNNSSNSGFVPLTVNSLVKPSFPTITSVYSLNQTSSTSTTLPRTSEPACSKSRPVLRFDAKTGEPIIGSVVTTKVNPITKPVKSATNPPPASKPRTVHVLPSFKNLKNGLQAQFNVVAIPSKGQDTTAPSSSISISRVVTPSSGKTNASATGNVETVDLTEKSPSKSLMSNMSSSTGQPKSTSFNQFTVHTANGVRCVKFNNLLPPLDSPKPLSVSRAKPATPVTPTLSIPSVSSLTEPMSVLNASTEENDKAPRKRSRSPVPVNVVIKLKRLTSKDVAFYTK